MTVINANGLTDSVKKIIDELLANGKPVEVRGHKTLELHPCLIQISDPTNRTLIYPKRGNNPFATLAETLWVLAGRNDLTFLSKFLPRAADFSDDGVVWRCLTGDTKIKLLNGESKTILDLIEDKKKGVKNFTYSYSNKGWTVGEIVDVFFTKKVKRKIKVTLDNNKSVESTLDHRFLMRNGEYEEAKDLIVGDSLMPLYDRINTSKAYGCNDYVEILDNVTGKWILVHQMVFNWTVKEYKQCIHHIDRKTTNNYPENLESLTHAEHRIIHAKDAQKVLFDLRKDNPELKEKYDAISSLNLKKANDEFKEKFGKDEKYTRKYVEVRSKNCVAMNSNPDVILKQKIGRIKKLLKDMIILNEQEYERVKNKKGRSGNRYPTIAWIVETFGSFDEMLSKLGVAKNHKIIAIEVIEDVETDMYDLIVDSEHNFVLDVGVVVHNSGYGPRIRNWKGFDDSRNAVIVDQIKFVVKCLTKDKGSRQAIISVWNPAKDCTVQSTKDYPCFVGSTIVHSPEGNIPIKDIKIGYPVYCYDEEKECIVLKKVTNSVCTGKKKIWKVLIDDGSVIETTENHHFMTKVRCKTGFEKTHGSSILYLYKEVKDLREGDSLIPIHYFDWTGCKNVHIYPKKNWANRNRNKESRMYYEFINGKIPDGMDIHHKDGNDQNNKIENLECLSKTKHDSELTAFRKCGSKNPHFTDSKYNHAERFVRHSPEELIEWGRKCLALDGKFTYRSFLKRVKETNYRPIEFHHSFGRFGNFKSIVYDNHKVVAVEETDKFEDVFDIEVEDCHNFFIGSGILVHNCSNWLHFMIRENKLDCTVVIRSNDLIWGYCLSGETKIRLLDGSIRPIKDLTDKEFWVYSKSIGGKIVPGKVKRCWKTGFKKIVKVNFSDGTFVKCTPNHQFLMKDGSYKDAEKLVNGDSIDSIYFRKDKRGYEELNNGDDWIYTHRMVAKEKCTIPEKAIDDSYFVVHHKDLDKENNDPENLEFMGEKTHMRHHAKLVEENYETILEAQRKGNENRWLKKENHKKQSELLRKMWENPDYRESRKEIIENFRNCIIERWKNPINALYMAQKISDHMKVAHKRGCYDTEIKRQSDIEKMKTYNQSDAGRKKSKETAIKTKVWEYSTYEDKMKGMNKIHELGLCHTPEVLEKARKTKVLKLFKKLEIQGLEFTEENYKKLCRQGCPGWKKAVVLFGSLDEIKEKLLVFNHTVVSVEDCGEEDVYDLEVEDHHNFTLENGVIVHNSSINMYEFSTLQEIIARVLGVDVGNYYQLSDSMHIYEEYNGFEGISKSRQLAETYVEVPNLPRFKFVDYCHDALNDMDILKFSDFYFSCIDKLCCELCVMDEADTMYPFRDLNVAAVLLEAYLYYQKHKDSFKEEFKNGILDLPFSDLQVSCLYWVEKNVCKVKDTGLDLINECIRVCKQWDDERRSSSEK